jgi:hypothetical protein
MPGLTGEPLQVRQKAAPPPRKKPVPPPGRPGARSASASVPSSQSTKPEIKSSAAVLQKLLGNKLLVPTPSRPEEPSEEKSFVAVKRKATTQLPEPVSSKSVEGSNESMAPAMGELTLHLARRGKASAYSSNTSAMYDRSNNGGNYKRRRVESESDESECGQTDSTTSGFRQ